MAKTGHGGPSDVNAEPGQTGYIGDIGRQGPKWDSRVSLASSGKPKKKSAAKTSASRKPAPNVEPRSTKA